jgi:peptidyl-dipeptidase Dcp
MAKTPEAALGLMDAVWKPALARVTEEVTDMQAIVKREGNEFAIAPWDYRYYAEKVRKAKYDLDMQQVSRYLQLDKMREAIFWEAGQLYGFSFTKVNAPVFAPEMSVYEVKDRAGRHVALWYFDPYARPIRRPAPGWTSTAASRSWTGSRPSPPTTPTSSSPPPASRC